MPEEKNIIKKFDEKILYQDKDGTRWNCMSRHEEKTIKQFILTELQALKEDCDDIINEEIKQCLLDGQPTSRITSLSNKLHGIAKKYGI
jgi:hypothetical protein